MIRKYIGADPSILSEEEYAQHLSEAMWLVQYEFEMNAKATELGTMKALVRFWNEIHKK